MKDKKERIIFIAFSLVMRLSTLDNNEVDNVLDCMEIVNGIIKKGE